MATYDSAWQCLVFEVRTGHIVNEIPLSAAPTWGRSLSGNSSLEVKCIVGGGGVPDRDTLRGIVSGGVYGLALLWVPTGWVATAGMIVTHSYEDSSHELTVGAVDAWGILNRRLLVNPSPPPGPPVPLTDVAWDINYLNLSLHDIAVSLVRDALAQPDGDLPITLPAMDGLGGNVRNYPGYDAVMVGQRLQELTQVIAGPDIDWQPRITDPQTLTIDMRVGAPLLMQPGQTVYLDYGSDLEELDIDGDASELANRATVKGSGTARDMVVATASQDPGTQPLLDYIDNDHSSVTDVATVTEYANSDLTFYSTGIETWSIVVRNSPELPLGTILPGYFITLEVNGHAWLPDGQYTNRVIGVSDGPSDYEQKYDLMATQGDF